MCILILLIGYIILKFIKKAQYFHLLFTSIIPIVSDVSKPFQLIALRVKFSADNILKYFSYFSQKIGFDISCKLSPVETICIEFQSLFSGKTKKNVIIACHLLNLPIEWHRSR